MFLTVEVHFLAFWIALILKINLSNDFDFAKKHVVAMFKRFVVDNLVDC